jgi:hypothetical protein
MGYWNIVYLSSNLLIRSQGPNEEPTEISGSSKTFVACEKFLMVDYYYFLYYGPL